MNECMRGGDGCVPRQNSFLGEQGLPLLLCLLIFAIVACIELRHPYFFFQDDNRGQNLPYYLHNLRALMGGEIPLFNFHQSLGTPMLACIQSAAFYPVNYLALFLSRLFLGHYYGAMEFIALFHLLVAGLGFYYFMRHFGLAGVSCFFGAIAWPFCAFVMTAGNSWIQVVGYAAFFPWILLFSAKLIHGFKWRWFLILGALRLFDLYLGYPPFFAYTVFFDLLTAGMLYCAFRRDKVAASFHAPVGAVTALPKFAAIQVGNYLLVVLFALPLLLPAYYQVSISADRQTVISWDDYVEFSYNLKHWVNGLITPFASVPDALWCDQHFISHIGYVTLFFVLVAFYRSWSGSYRRLVVVFALLGSISFLWAGDVIVTRILYHVPVYNRLRWPFKLEFFTSFYLITIAAIGFNYFAEKVRIPRSGSGKSFSPGIFVLLAIHVANFLILYTVLPQHMFSKHLDVPPFADPFKNDEMRDGRIASVGLSTVMEGNKRIYGNSVPMLGFDYPTLFGLYGFGGYELLLAEKNLRATFGLRERSVFVVEDEPLDMRTGLPLDYLREWGVKWYVVDNDILLANRGDLEFVRSDGFRTILFDPAAKNFAYWLDAPLDRSVTWDFTTNSMVIKTSRDTFGPLLVNLLHNRFFRAQIDGRPVGITETPDGQMLVTVPAGVHSVLLSYVDPYFIYGVSISGGSVVIAVAAFIVFSRRRKHAAGASAATAFAGGADD